MCRPPSGGYSQGGGQQVRMFSRLLASIIFKAKSGARDVLYCQTLQQIVHNFVYTELNLRDNNYCSPKNLLPDRLWCVHRSSLICPLMSSTFNHCIFPFAGVPKVSQKASSWGVLCFLQVRVQLVCLCNLSLDVEKFIPLKKCL